MPRIICPLFDHCASALASANAAPASNNDDLQQEMQRIFRPEKLMAQFKAYLSDYEDEATIKCYQSLLPLLTIGKDSPEWVFRSEW